MKKCSMVKFYKNKKHSHFLSQSYIFIKIRRNCTIGLHNFSKNKYKIIEICYYSS